MSDAATTSDIPIPVAVLEEIARGTKAALERIERRLDAIEERLDRMDGRLDRMDGRLDRMVSEHRADYRWLLSLIIGGNAALLGVMAHGFHWL